MNACKGSATVLVGKGKLGVSVQKLTMKTRQKGVDA